MVGIGGGFKDWRRILQVTSALHLVTPLLANYFPESPKWLLARKDIGRESELRSILTNAASVNGKYNDDSEKKIETLFLNNTKTDSVENTKDRFVDTLRYNEKKLML